jgi:A/G-specific adenine glycosylase
MELGATVCTPQSPKCLICPVNSHCAAAARGLQEQIPPPKKPVEQPLLKRKVLCIRRGDAYLIEQRPAKGRWAGMWQFVTIDASAKAARIRMKLTRPKRIGEVRHTLTHRRYEFDVYAADVTCDGVDPSPRVWVTLKQLDRYPLPRPHLKVVEMLKAQLSR